ncbi:MAG: DUF5672 family protein [Verrucomicrobiota bacterium]|jgi:hypothetical protein
MSEGEVKTSTWQQTMPDKNRNLRVAIVMPTQKNALTADEQISVRHLGHFLGKYDRYLVVPPDSGLRLDGFEPVYFEKRCFENTGTYSSLLMSTEFYRRFAAYTHLLIYQLDCLVFSDQLEYWCSQEWDYIGAPWWTSWSKAPGPDDRLHGAGNGGLSLRKVSPFLKVLNSCKSPFNTWAGWKTWHARRRRRQITSGLKLALGYLRVMPTASWYASGHPQYRWNEDKFWAFEAVKFNPNFKVAPVSAALRFSFEVAPRRCYELNEMKLPFCCHAWNRYDREFWEPFLLK